MSQRPPDPAAAKLRAEVAHYMEQNRPAATTRAEADHRRQVVSIHRSGVARTVDEATAFREREKMSRAQHPQRCEVYCECGKRLARLWGSGGVLAEVGGPGDVLSRSAPSHAPDPRKRPAKEADPVEALIADGGWSSSRRVLKCGNPRCRHGRIPVRHDTLARAFAAAVRAGRQEIRFPEDFS